MPMRPMVILAGPSAVGKTTVMAELLRRADLFSFVHSATTRPIRFEGDDEYLYLSMDAFLALRDGGGLMESTIYGDCAYGTPRAEVDEIIESGRMPLLILDINGVRTLKGQSDVPVLAVYIYDSLNVMEERLYARELKDHPSVPALLTFNKRKEQNIRDYSEMPQHAPYFDLFIKNDTDLSAAVEQVLALTSGARAPMTDEEKREPLAFFAREVEEKLSYARGN